MRTATIALVGAPDSGQVPLFALLTDYWKPHGEQVCVVMDDPVVRPTPCELVLLMGLSTQLPAAIAADQLIRQSLAQSGIRYEVLYGTTQERLTQALQLIETRLAKPPSPSTPRVQVEPQQKPWVWLCDKCSDSQCEHTLLTQLLAQRATAP